MGGMEDTFTKVVAVESHKVEKACREINRYKTQQGGFAIWVHDAIPPEIGLHGGRSHWMLVLKQRGSYPYVEDELNKLFIPVMP